MKYQANRNYTSNDVVMTPIELAERIVAHFKPEGKILEPCCGTGNFLKFMEADWCEITKGKDFFDCTQKYDWIVTNPPWSQVRKFLNHSMKLADNIVFLMTTNHLFTKARLRDIKENGFGIKEIYLVDTPKEFPPSGFQLSAIHLKRNHQDNIIITL